MHLIPTYTLTLFRQAMTTESMTCCARRCLAIPAFKIGISSRGLEADFDSWAALPKVPDGFANELRKYFLKHQILDPLPDPTKYRQSTPLDCNCEFHSQARFIHTSFDTHQKLPNAFNLQFGKGLHSRYKLITHGGLFSYRQFGPLLSFLLLTGLPFFADFL